MNNLKVKKMNKKKKGFTLIELIIVIAIIAILAAMAIPKFSAVRVDARVSNDVAAAKNIQTAAQTLIANGALTDDDDVDDVSATGDDNKNAVAIAKRVTTVTPEAKSGCHFKVEIDNGEATVSVVDGDTSYQLAPENTDDKKDYITAAQG